MASTKAQFCPNPAFIERKIEHVRKRKIEPIFLRPVSLIDGGRPGAVTVGEVGVLTAKSRMPRESVGKSLLSRLNQDFQSIFDKVKNLTGLGVLLLSQGPGYGWIRVYVETFAENEDVCETELAYPRAPKRGGKLSVGEKPLEPPVGLSLLFGFAKDIGGRAAP